MKVCHSCGPKCTMKRIILSGIFKSIISLILQIRVGKKSYVDYNIQTIFCIIMFVKAKQLY